MLRQALASRSLRSILLTVAATVCLVTAGWLLVVRYIATTGVAPAPDSSQTVTEDTTAPSEVPVAPQEIDTYTVPADQPRSIKLPSIGVTGLVQKVGLTKDNAVAVPTNIHFAGWYTGSVLPGAKGLSVIDGHVTGNYVDGVFKALKDLKTGDTVTIEFGDKSTKDFQVVSVTTQPEAAADNLLFEQRNDISSQLNLITCGGTFNRTTQRYNDRVVVVTKLVKAS